MKSTLIDDTNDITLIDTDTSASENLFSPLPSTSPMEIRHIDTTEDSIEEASSLPIPQGEHSDNINPDILSPYQMTEIEDPQMYLTQEETNTTPTSDLPQSEYLLKEWYII